MKIFIAKHKETGKIWCGRKQAYETIGGLKTAMKRHWCRDDIAFYDIYVSELTDMELYNEPK